MSGGIAYVWDPNKVAEKYISDWDGGCREYLDLQTRTLQKFTAWYRSILNIPVPTGRIIYFTNWSTEKDNFWKIIPDKYRKALAKG